MRAIARSGGENVFVGRALPVVGRLDSDRWVRCSGPGGSEAKGCELVVRWLFGATQCGVWTARAAANWENHGLAGLVGSTLDGLWVAEADNNKAERISTVERNLGRDVGGREVGRAVRAFSRPASGRTRILCFLREDV